MRAVIGRHLLLVVLIAAACARGEGDEVRVRRFVAERLGVATGELRITRRTDLSTERHRFLRVTTAQMAGDLDARAMTVVVSRGALIDDTMPDGFEQLSRAEDAARRIDQLGAGRVAGWFGALGGDVCRAPLDDGSEAAIATHRRDGGVEIRYRFAVSDSTGTAVRECVIDLAPDGTLRGSQARDVTAGSRLLPVPRAAQRS